jgi:hypothetical protein
LNKFDDLHLDDDGQGSEGSIEVRVEL